MLHLFFFWHFSLNVLVFKLNLLIYPFCYRTLVVILIAICKQLHAKSINLFISSIYSSSGQHPKHDQIYITELAESIRRLFGYDDVFQSTFSYLGKSICCCLITYISGWPTRTSAIAGELINSVTSRCWV